MADRPSKKHGAFRLPLLLLLQLLLPLLLRLLKSRPNLT
jgi:hypothetical protein